jgi:ribosomal protein S18 acetylase RimI-like enzyme
MIITTDYKSTDFNRLREISDACYTGDERPPHEIMKDMVEVCDVFLAKESVPRDPDGGNPYDMIIGFALVRTSGNPYVWSIAVDKQFQERGVGGNLLREIIKKYTLQKEIVISLHVHEDNPAQKLYFDYGFRVRKVEEAYYMPKDGLLMKRLL